MSKERLEEIKSVSEFQIDNDSYYGRPANVTLKGDDVKWLIEQAGIGINTSRDKQALIKSNIALNERVQELERELEEHKSKFTVDYTMSLRKRNKRYREALEKIKSNVKICGNEEYFPKVIEEIVNEALEAIRND